MQYYPKYYHSSFSRQSRHNFIQKVYFLVLLSLCISIGSVALDNHHHFYSRYQETTNTVFACSILFGIGCIVAACCDCISKDSVFNTFLFIVFTFCQSIFFIKFHRQYEIMSMVKAALVILFTFLAVTFYALSTDNDFTSKESLWDGVGFSLMSGIVSGIIFMIAFEWDLLLFMGTALIVGLFTAYILVCTHLVLGGKYVEISLDDSVIGFFALYLGIAVCSVAVIFVALKEINK